MFLSPTLLPFSVSLYFAQRSSGHAHSSSSSSSSSVPTLSFPLPSFVCTHSRNEPLCAINLPGGGGGGGGRRRRLSCATPDRGRQHGGKLCWNLDRIFFITKSLLFCQFSSLLPTTTLQLSVGVGPTPTPKGKRRPARKGGGDVEGSSETAN